MNSLFLRITAVVLSTGIGSLVPAVGGEIRSAPAGSNHIQHLSFDLAESDTTPLMEMATPPELESSLLRLTSHEIPVLQTPKSAENRASTATVTPGVAAGVPAEKIQQVRESARDQMRESFLKEGQEANSNRDQLTAEFFSVMRWTVVVLVIGGCVAVGLKKMPQLQRPQVAGTKMSLIETLPLGRHQVLNLVQAGGERFLVATDAAGIKSVTLLPAWESDDEVEDSTSPSKTHPELTSQKSPFDKLLARSRAA